MPKENKSYFFDRQYRFYGSHALRVDALTAVFDSDSKAQLFRRNLDVYINAPLIGFLYGRMADRDDILQPIRSMTRISWVNRSYMPKRNFFSTFV